MAKQEATMQSQRTYTRFNVVQRIEHIVLIASFSTLAVTGLVQKFAGNPIAEGIIRALGGIEHVRTFHHIAAIVFVLQCIYHFILLTHKVFVRRVEMTMLPGLKDAVDAIDLVRYNLGLTNEHPRMPRYNFAEKAEYWALIWGAVVMGITGFMLWNPIALAKLFPGQLIPAAKAAHGGEAVLAVLAILVWHIYNVHIKSFNKAMFTGKLSRHEMEEEHAEELARLEAGQLRPPASAEAVRRRERIFLPMAIVAAVVMVLGLYWLTTFEKTAIATVVPVASPVPVFVPITPTPGPTPTSDNGSLGAPMPHPIQGQEQCDTCHGPSGIKPYPANHAGRPNDSCQVCHQPGPQTATSGGGTAPAIPHDTAGKEQCSLCHGESGSLVPVPADHAGRADATCTACHKLAGASGTAEAGAAPAGAVAPAIPHSTTKDIFKDCTACHGQDKPVPVPASHASYTADTCTGCHQLGPETLPAVVPTVEPGMPKPIPHDIVKAIYQDCTACHGIDKPVPVPENHATFPASTCAGCHKPVAQ